LIVDREAVFIRFRDPGEVAIASGHGFEILGTRFTVSAMD